MTSRTLKRVATARAASAAALAAALVTTLVTTLAGCSSEKGPHLEAPEVLVSPYSVTGSGEVLWAVAPLNNESGTTAVDSLMVSDALVNKITETEGLGAVPMNRTLAAMRLLKMDAVRSPADARKLAEALGVDGVLAGSITSYDPYSPPKIGLSLGVFGRGGAMVPQTSRAGDPGVMRGGYSEQATGTSRFGDRPLTAVNLQFDGASHAVLMDVERYATGRHDYDSALGWQRYVTSMELFTDYAAHASVRRVLDDERLRLAGLAAPAQGTAARAVVPGTPSTTARASVDGGLDERR
jgi:hypothetical protein